MIDPIDLSITSLCPDEFNVYTHEAGAGVLSVTIEGPSKATIDVVDRGTGFVTVSYTVQTAGENPSGSSLTQGCIISLIFRRPFRE